MAAWDDLDCWRAGLGDRELRLLAFQTSPAELKTVGQSDQNASVARLLRLLAAGGRGGSAFELAERRRARELMDALLQAEALRTGVKADAKSLQARPADPVTADAIAASLPDESTALLEFIVGNQDGPATLFVVHRSGLQITRWRRKRRCRPRWRDSSLSWKAGPTPASLQVASERPCSSRRLRALAPRLPGW